MAKIEIIKEEELNGDVWFHVYLDGMHQKSKNNFDDAKIVAFEIKERIKNRLPRKTTIYSEII